MNNAQMNAIRQIATLSAAGYTHRLHFTREFTRGTLAGLTHDDAIPFCSAAACDEWVSTVNRKKSLDYKVTSYRIELL